MPKDAAARKEQDDEVKDVAGVAGQRLKSLIERIERLEDEKKGLADDVKDVYAEAKGVGFEPKIIKRIIKIKAMDAQKRQEEDELLELYKSAIGLV